MIFFQKSSYHIFVVGIPSFLQHAIQTEIRQTRDFLIDGMADSENFKKVKKFTLFFTNNYRLLVS